jgi:hypothetical protein
MNTKMPTVAAMVSVGLCWTSITAPWAFGSSDHWDGYQDDPMACQYETTQIDALVVENPFVERGTWDVAELGQDGDDFVRIANPHVDASWVDRALPKWQGPVKPQVVFPVSAVAKTR